MALSRITQLEVFACQLEVPLADFDVLPARLGTTLTHRADGLVLTHEQPRCFLRFELQEDPSVLEQKVRLAEVRVEEDIQGLFFQQVLGALLIEYQGDFHGELEWNQPQGRRSEVVVLKGETTFPLLASLQAARGGPLPELEVALLPEETGVPAKAEAALELARAAWNEYQRIKGGPGKSSSNQS